MSNEIKLTQLEQRIEALDRQLFEVKIRLKHSMNNIHQLTSILAFFLALGDIMYQLKKALP